MTKKDPLILVTESLEQLPNYKRPRYQRQRFLRKFPNRKKSIIFTFFSIKYIVLSCLPLLQYHYDFRYLQDPKPVTDNKAEKYAKHNRPLPDNGPMVAVSVSIEFSVLNVTLCNGQNMF